MQAHEPTGRALQRRAERRRSFSTARKKFQIKQVASCRFGVNSEDFDHAEVLQ